MFVEPVPSVVGNTARSKDCAKNFKDDGTFALEAPADPFLQDTAPPVQGAGQASWGGGWGERGLERLEEAAWVGW